VGGEHVKKAGNSNHRKTWDTIKYISMQVEGVPKEREKRNRKIYFKK
jgi:hypothetical protein